MNARPYHSQQRYQHQTAFGPYKATDAYDYDYQGAYPSTMYPHDRTNSHYGFAHGGGSGMGMSSVNGVMQGAGMGTYDYQS